MTERNNPNQEPFPWAFNAPERDQIEHGADVPRSVAPRHVPKAEQTANTMPREAKPVTGSFNPEQVDHQHMLPEHTDANRAA